MLLFFVWVWEIECVVFYNFCRICVVKVFNILFVKIVILVDVEKI